MVGYTLEFKRNYCLSSDRTHHDIFPLGEVELTSIVDSTDLVITMDSTPRGNLEIAVSRVPTPGISPSFMAPVNDVSSLAIPLAVVVHLTGSHVVHLTGSHVLIAC